MKKKMTRIDVDIETGEVLLDGVPIPVLSATYTVTKPGEPGIVNLHVLAKATLKAGERPIATPVGYRVEAGEPNAQP